MFDQVDEKLRAWVHTTLEAAEIRDAEVTFSAPGREEGVRGVGLFLLEIVADPAPRGLGAAPLRLALRYLVTTWGAPAEAHRLLGELAFAALANPELTTDLTPLGPATWTALGAEAQPAFVVQLPVERERALTAAPRVSEGLRLDTSQLGGST